MQGYLYGAAVSGIQNYIFSGNTLKEIIGASELVERICSDEFLKPYTCDKKILGAAGNIRLFFKTRSAVEKIVREFPLKVRELAPGLNFSQAVVPVTDAFTPEAIMKQLSERLNTGKNKISIPARTGVTAAARSSLTDLPVVYIDDSKTGEYMDIVTLKKAAAGKGKILINKLAGSTDGKIKKWEDWSFANNLLNMVSPENRHWLAVIHIDGNNLGKTLDRLFESIKEETDYFDVYRQFSSALGEATLKAHRDAFDDCIKHPGEILKDIKDNIFPYRPVIMGGDDLTVICRGELALGFTESFLGYFKKHTCKKLGRLGKKYPSLGWLGEGLTACGGVVFCKNTFPFHYAVSLAEELCVFAKQRSKKGDAKIVPSSFAFYRVQSGFSTTYGDIKEGALSFGPYAVDENIKSMPVFHLLSECVAELKKDPPLASGLRDWLGEVAYDPESAGRRLTRVFALARERNDQYFNRFDSLFKGLTGGDSLEDYTNPSTAPRISPVGDLITLMALEGK